MAETKKYLNNKIQKARAIQIKCEQQKQELQEKIIIQKNIIEETNKNQLETDTSKRSEDDR